MNKAYNPIDWKNEPNTSTPINETNLNKMDRAIDTIDNRVISLDSEKVSKEEGKSLVSNTDIYKIGANETAIQNHISDKSNPHSVTKSQVGLGNCDNTSDADKPISTAQKAEFDRLNDSLDGLGYGENGAYNLLDLSKLLDSSFDIEEGNITNKIADTRTYFNIQAYLCDRYGKLIDVAIDAVISSNESKDFTFSLTSGCEKIRLKHNGSLADIFIGEVNIADIGLKENDTITVHISVSSADPTVVGGIVIKELAIVKGDTFIGYKPFIPSVKMLSADVASLKNDLSAVQSNTILNYESTTVDLDSLTGHPLIASVNTGATNAPTGFGGGYMIVVYAGSSSAALYQTLVDVVKNKTYRRKLYHGSWSDWSLTAN